MDEAVKALCASLLSQPIFLILCIIGIIGVVYSLFKNIVSVGKSIGLIAIFIVLYLIITPLANSINADNVYSIMIGIAIFIFAVIGVIFVIIKKQDSKSSREVETNNIEHSNEIKEENILNCPKCGGKLKLRNGKYGSFYGCSNYPNCKYTQKVENSN